MCRRSCFGHGFRVLPEPPQRVEVPDVKRIDGNSRAAARVRLLRLDENRPPVQTTVHEQPAKCIKPDTSGADVFVSIDPAPAGPLGIVPVQHVEPIESDKLLKTVERIPITGFIGDVVAGCDEMTRVEADPGAR